MEKWLGHLIGKKDIFLDVLKFFIFILVVRINKMVENR